MIRGNLIELRLFREADLPLLSRWTREDHDSPEWFQRRIESETETRDRFSTDSGFWSTDRGRLMIEPLRRRRGASPGSAGFITFWRPAPSISDAYEIGIYLSISHRRGGYGTEAQSLLARFLFENRPTGRVQATTAVENTSERAALEKAGFRVEGVLRDWFWAGGRRRDAALYSMTRQEWEAIRPASPSRPDSSRSHESSRSASPPPKRGR